MPDGSNFMSPEVTTPQADLPTVATRIFALVAALDLLNEHEGSFCEQDKIRDSLTMMAFSEARALSNRLAG